MCDPDFSWLLNTFKENHPEYVAVESSCLPIVLVSFAAQETKVVVGVTNDNLADENSEDSFASSDDLAIKEEHRGS